MTVPLHADQVHGNAAVLDALEATPNVGAACE
jgi:hypothetical protein